jgi:hypothetical protein
MRSRTSLVVVVGFFLCLMAPERWGEAAESSTPRWLRPPDTIPENALLWEGVAVTACNPNRLELRSRHVSGPHSLHLTTPPGPDSVHLSLQSSP